MTFSSKVGGIRVDAEVIPQKFPITVLVAVAFIVVVTVEKQVLDAVSAASVFETSGRPILDSIFVDAKRI